MISLADQPHPYAKPDRQGAHETPERIALAFSLCRARGAHLTTRRRQVLELLWESGRPTGAYELIEAMKFKTSRSVAPPTVYRALEFLMSRGLAAKIESLNAYLPRAHPEQQSDPLFLICSMCGSSAELQDLRLEHLIAGHAALIGFSPTRRVIEIEGACKRCKGAKKDNK